MIPGLVSQAKKVYPLADPKTELSCDYQGGTAIISLPEKAPDPYASVIVLEFLGKPEVVRSPEISAESDIFHKDLRVSISSNLEKTTIHYTLDGNQPTSDSPVYQDVIRLIDSTTVTAQVFRAGQPISGVVEKLYRKIPPRPAEIKAGSTPGLHYAYYRGDFERLPDFAALPPETQGTVERFDLSPRTQKEYFAIRFKGYITVPEDGLYRFYVVSDDGSQLYIGSELIVNNDGLHGPTEVTGRIILEKGAHPIHVDFFQRTGGLDFEVTYSGPGIDKQPIPAEILSH
jgi:alpha-L-fucosidase